MASRHVIDYLPGARNHPWLSTLHTAVLGRATTQQTCFSAMRAQPQGLWYLDAQGREKCRAVEPMLRIGEPAAAAHKVWDLHTATDTSVTARTYLRTNPQRQRRIRPHPADNDTNARHNTAQHLGIELQMRDACHVANVEDLGNALTLSMLKPTGALVFARARAMQAFIDSAAETLTGRPRRRPAAPQRHVRKRDIVHLREAIWCGTYLIGSAPPSIRPHRCRVGVVLLAARKEGQTKGYSAFQLAKDGLGLGLAQANLVWLRPVVDRFRSNLGWPQPNI